MVVFTCNHCGDSLQKPRVEKHYNLQCRKPKSLTCVDCFKDFKNEEYVVHTKCITEEERYAAKGSIPGGIVNKGDVKQESWTDMIKSIVDSEQNIKPSLKKLFETISHYTNVPRKKNKFLNFLKNSLGSRVNFGDVESAWDLIEKYKSKSSETNGKETVAAENGCKHKLNGNNDEAPAKKKKKVEENGHDSELNKEQEKVEGDGNDNMTSVKKKKKKSKGKTVDEAHTADEGKPEENVEAEKFSFKNTILTILTEKSSIPMKKLQKKVLNAYVKETGNEYTEKTIKKYNKKLKKIPNVTISDDVVTLRTTES